MSGPRIERFDLGDHLGEILGIDPAYLHQRRGVAGGEQRQVVEQKLHRRIEPVAIAQLQRQAFCEIARENAGRFEFLYPRQHALDIRSGAAQLPGGRVAIDAQIAGLVEVLEQMRGDNPIDRIAKIGADLFAQVFAQAARTACRPLDGRLTVVAAPGPVPGTPQIVVATVFVRAVAILAGRRLPVLGGIANNLANAASQLLGKRQRSGIHHAYRLAGADRRVIALRLAGFQQRVFLDLGLDEFAQFEVRQLQQLYRLLQLRRHHQRLALPQLQALRKTDPVHQKLRRGGLTG